MLTCALDSHTHLRLLNPSDAQDLFNLIDTNRSHLRPWFEMVDLTKSVDDTTAWLERMSARAAESPRGWSGIFHNNQLVGSVGVSELDQVNKRCEIGFYLAANACGQGLATRAVRALLDHLFTDKKFHRVAARVAVGNTRSLNLLRKLGFTQESILRDADSLDDRPRDVLLFGLSPPIGALVARAPRP